MGERKTGTLCFVKSIPRVNGCKDKKLIEIHGKIPKKHLASHEKLNTNEELGSYSHETGKKW